MVRNNSSAGRDAPYFPNKYFRRQVVNYMVNHPCLIYENKFIALMSLYGVEETDPSRSWNPPLSFKEYLRCLLRKDFWGGDEIVLYTISCMWCLKITVLNTQTLQEYQIRHDRVMDHADAVLTFLRNHFNVEGEWSSGWSLCTICLILLVKVLVAGSLAMVALLVTL